MATISNTPRPGYIYDTTDGVWYPIGTGAHSHSEIPKTIVDAKGDLIAGTAADTVSRLAVGTDGQLLTADSTQTTGIKWSDAPNGGMTLLSTTTLTGTTVSVTGISGSYKHLFCIVNDATNSATGGNIQIGVNSGGNNYFYLWKLNGGAAGTASANQYGILVSPPGSGKGTGSFWIYNYANASYWKSFSSNFIAGTSAYSHYSTGGGIALTNAITSIQLVESGTGFAAGQLLIYGVN